MYFLTFSGVCTYYFQCFEACAHPFHGLLIRVRSFFQLLLKCAQLLSPAAPNSGVRVPDSGCCWLAVPPAGGQSHSFHKRFH
jgi:hypothetical protein